MIEKITRRIRLAFQYVKGDIPLHTFILMGLPSSLFPALSQYIELNDLLEGVLLQDQYHAKPLIKRDAVVIDAGANIGLFSILASALAPEGHVYAFEPASETHKVLCKTVAGITNITVVEKGLGGERGVAPFAIAGSMGTNHIVTKKNPLRRWKSIEIPITTIDDYVRENGLARVDFIKMDTEGFEAQIISGAQKTIKAFRPIISMSAYHDPEDKVELPKLLNSIAPYTCELFHAVEEDLVCTPQ